MQVTLVVPWLAISDQVTVFAGKYTFSQPSEQEECIRQWVHHRVGFRPTFKVVFYMGRYDRRLLGIFPVGDVTSYVPAHQARLLPGILWYSSAWVSQKMATGSLHEQCQASQDLHDRRHKRLVACQQQQACSTHVDITIVGT